MQNDAKEFDVVIIGGGLFGSSLALFLSKYFSRIIILEKENDLFQRASYNNQARVHNGYHYPRSFLTAHRSHVNFHRFSQDYSECIVDNFEKVYAIGRQNSKVTAKQFMNFMDRVGSPLKVAPKAISQLFNPALVEAIFIAKEVSFDAVKLKEHFQRDLKKNGIIVELNIQAEKVIKITDKLLSVVSKSDRGLEKISAKYVFNCSYSQINELLENSHLTKIPLKHELTEMPLVHVPNVLENLAITMMCGPFFSLMPFPPKKMHVLSHVRYTPHNEWYDTADKPYFNAHCYFETLKKNRLFVYMKRDGGRYLPPVLDARYSGESIWEVKTILPQSEHDDGRPILFRRHTEMPNLTCIMGGKIDNIYEIPEELTFLEHE